MADIDILIGELRLSAVFEDTLAPLTCAAFRKLLPYREQLIHVRWSGEACWIPMGEFDLGVPVENATSYPAPGQVIFYPGGVSETEILIAYGGVRFASKAGQLAGNHFLTITKGREHLARIGRAILRGGAKPVVFQAA